MEKEEDIPKSIVVVLVILAVAISLLGTITVITQINSLNQAPVSQGTQVQSGKVRFEIQEPPASPVVSGKVAFTVQENNLGGLQNG